MTVSLPMRWLAAGVPLSLLFDLALPPDSYEVLLVERRQVGGEGRRVARIPS